MALTDSTWYVNYGDGSTTGHYAVAKRPQNTVVVAGQIVRQFTAPSVGNERVFVCIVAGTTANVTDATWVITRGAKTVDGTATWMECSGQAALNGDLTNTKTWTEVKAVTPAVLGQVIKRSNNASYQICTTAGAMSASEPTFSNTAGVTTTDTTAVWTSLGPVGNFTGGQAPFARLVNIFTTNWFASGNTVYVGDNHAEVQTAGFTMAPSSALLAKILCHNHSGSYPPVASDITTGATVTTSGSCNFTGQGSFYIYGIIFYPAGSLTIGAAAVGQTQNWYYLDNCSLRTDSTIGITLGASSTGWGIIILNNTTVKFSLIGASTAIIPYFVNLTWQNTGPVLASGSLVPTTFIQATSATGRFGNITLNNLDLSQLTGSLFSNSSTNNPYIGSLIVQDCKLNAALTVTTPINTGMNVQFIRSDSAGTSYKSARYAYEGTETTETSIVRTNGALDPTGQAQSRKIVTTANTQWLRPFKAEPMVIWNQTTGANITVTAYGIVADGVLPNNDDVFMEVEYLGSATDPLGKIVSTSKASLLASDAAVASDSSVWSSPAYTTFDGTPSTNVVMSNGNLTATHGSISNNVGVASIAALAGGKYYFEITPVFTGLIAGSVGILLSTGAVADMGALTNSTKVDFHSSSSAIISNGASTGKNLGATASGNVFGFAIDLTARLAWLRRGSGNWNGDVSADPVTGIGGVTIAAGAFAPAVRFSSSQNNTDTITGNFGQLTYANAAPSGYGNWNGWVPFKLATTLSSPQPQLAGYLHARVRVAKTITTYYVDPRVELT